MRGGTTTLYRHLANHSLVRAALDKEIHYFTKNRHHGLGWYRAFFPLRCTLTDDAITGEATPYYIYHPRVPRLVAETLPGVRLIALLRDPVERAFSHYQWTKSRGYESLAFEEALEVEEKRLKGEQERLSESGTYDNEVHQRFSYKARGKYAEQMERWFAEFDRASILVLKSEELFDSPSSTISEVLGFLGLPDEDLGVLPHRNKSSDEVMEPKVKARLASYFEPHNQKLIELLGWGRGWS